MEDGCVFLMTKKVPFSSPSHCEQSHVPFLLQILTFFCVLSLTRGRIIRHRTLNQVGAPTIIITSCGVGNGKGIIP